MDLRHLKNWRPFREKNCDTCLANCCYLPTEVEVEDLKRLGWIEEDEVEIVGLKAIALRLTKEKKIESFHLKSGKFTLTQLSNGRCILLNSENRCSVYANRPKVCRDFPSKTGPKIGYCPYQSKNHLIKGNR